MKDLKINAIVINDFNDKTKIVDGFPYHYVKNEIIKDMKRDRFEELKAMGFVEEYYDVKKIEQIQEQENNN